MRKKIMRIIQFVLVIILIVASYKIYKYKKANEEFEIKKMEIKKDLEIWEDEFIKETPQIKKATLSEDTSMKENIDKIESSKILYLNKQYPAIIAWIKIPGTSIDLPVVQGKDNIFYLDHDYKGNYDSFGTVFMEMANSSDFSDQNSILYGHNVRTGKVFNDLHEYKDPEFIKIAPIIEISNFKGLNQYRIFAAYIANPDDNFRTPNYDDDDYKIFYNRIIENNILDEEMPRELKGILTLQTCSSNNKRLIIHAIKIDD